MQFYFILYIIIIFLVSLSIYEFVRLPYSFPNSPWIYDYNMSYGAKIDSIADTAMLRQLGERGLSTIDFESDPWITTDTDAGEIGKVEAISTINLYGILYRIINNPISDIGVYGLAMLVDAVYNLQIAKCTPIKSTPAIHVKLIDKTLFIMAPPFDALLMSIKPSNGEIADDSYYYGYPSKKNLGYDNVANIPYNRIGFDNIGIHDIILYIKSTFVYNKVVYICYRYGFGACHRLAGYIYPDSFYWFNPSDAFGVIKGDNKSIPSIPNLILVGPHTPISPISFLNAA